MGKNTLNLRLFFLLTVSFVYFFISLSLIDFYVSGDQVHYHRLFFELHGVSATDVMDIARNNISANEPVYPFFLWVVSQSGFSKSLFIALANTVLIASLVTFVLKYRVHFIFLPFVLSNFYILVLMTSAERLKFAVIFLLVANVRFPPMWSYSK